jgi:hypothetical protein
MSMGDSSLSDVDCHDLHYERLLAEFGFMAAGFDSIPSTTFIPLSSSARPKCHFAEAGRRHIIPTIGSSRTTLRTGEVATCQPSIHTLGRKSTPHPVLLMRDVDVVHRAPVVGIHLHL